MHTFTFSRRMVSLGRIVLLLVIIFGILGVFYVGHKVSESRKHDLLLRAQNIALLADATDIKNLSGEAEDIDTPEYEQAKAMLTEIRALNTDTRFVYFMGLDGDTQFFYADSEDPLSEDYSPPGQVYEDVLPIDIQNHRKGIAYINGPYSDSWGTWISAYAPVVEDGKVIALVGMDVDAQEFVSSVRLAQLSVGIIALLIVILILVLTRYLKRSSIYVSELERLNRDLEINREYLLEGERTARLGQFTWNTATNTMTLSSIVMELCNTKNPKMPLDTFLGFIHPEDFPRLKKDFETLAPDATSMTAKYRLLAGTEEHKMVSVCKIKRGSKNEILRVMCTAQEVLD